MILHNAEQKVNSFFVNFTTLIPTHSVDDREEGYEDVWSLFLANMIKFELLKASI